MNESAFRMYIVSICACKKTEDISNTTDEVIYWEHTPLLITSISLQEAAKQVKTMIYQSWKVEDGWIMHSAKIVPMPASFTKQLLNLIQQGFMVTEENIIETAQFLKFNERILADSEDMISINLH